MNIDKKAAQARIESLKSEMSELERIINAPDEPTYGDIIESIRPIYYFDAEGDISAASMEHANCYLDKQTAEREALRAKWLNIAAYVNDGWTPDWNERWENADKKWFVKFNHNSFLIDYVYNSTIDYVGAVYFKSESAAREAVRIMGEADLKKMAGIE